MRSSTNVKYNKFWCKSHEMSFDKVDPTGCVLEYALISFNLVLFTKWKTFCTKCAPTFWFPSIWVFHWKRKRKRKKRIQAQFVYEACSSAAAAFVAPQQKICRTTKLSKFIFKSAYLIAKRSVVSFEINLIWHWCKLFDFCYCNKSTIEQLHSPKFVYITEKSFFGTNDIQSTER